MLSQARGAHQGRSHQPIDRKPADHGHDRALHAGGAWLFDHDSPACGVSPDLMAALELDLPGETFQYQPVDQEGRGAARGGLACRYSAASVPVSNNDAPVGKGIAKALVSLPEHLLPLSVHGSGAAMQVPQWPRQLPRRGKPSGTRREAAQFRYLRSPPSRRLGSGPIELALLV